MAQGAIYILVEMCTYWLVTEGLETLWGINTDMVYLIYSRCDIFLLDLNSIFYLFILKTFNEMQGILKE
jgi:hypothetical protein